MEGLHPVLPDFSWRGSEWETWARREDDGGPVAGPLFWELPDPFSCQIHGRNGFLPLRTEQPVPGGFCASEPPAEERDLGWVLGGGWETCCQPRPWGPGFPGLEKKRTKGNQVLIEFDFH